MLDTLNKVKENNQLNSILINDSLEYINLNINLLTDASANNTYDNKTNKGKATQNKSLFDAKV